MKGNQDPMKSQVAHFGSQMPLSSPPAQPDPFSQEGAKIAATRPKCEPLHTQPDAGTPTRKEFCQGLEAQLAAMTAERDAAFKREEDCLKNWSADMARLEKLVTALRQQLAQSDAAFAQARNAYDNSEERCRVAEQALEACRRERDRLQAILDGAFL